MLRTLPLLIFCVAGPMTALALDLVEVPAGSFTMGAEGYATPLHEVTLTRDYWLGRTEVTNAELRDALQHAYDAGFVTVSGDWVRGWDRNLVRVGLSGQYTMHELRFDAGSGQFQVVPGTGVYANWGPGFEPYDAEASPANYMTWYGAAAVCDFLSLMEGLEPYYWGNWNQTPEHNPYTAEGYRLPTEAEWEHAARWPDSRLRPWGTGIHCGHANTRWSGSYCTGWTRAVGTHPAGDSELGLADLVGNINEWLGDWSAAYPATAVVDPLGPPEGTHKILRGGSWTAQGADPTTVQRRDEPPTADTGSPWFAGSFGLRVARTIPADDTVQAEELLPRSLALLAAYPNPFNPTTTIPLQLAETGHLRLSIHDLLGREQVRLHDGLLSAGEHRFLFEAGELPGGLYIATVESETLRRSIKLLLVR
jgi:formylglycine-generating enzyme required for sulfatase activity